MGRPTLARRYRVESDAKLGSKLEKLFNQRTMTSPAHFITLGIRTSHRIHSRLLTRMKRRDDPRIPYFISCVAALRRSAESGLLTFRFTMMSVGRTSFP